MQNWAIVRRDDRPGSEHPPSVTLPGAVVRPTSAVEVDACAYLFRACRRLQQACGDAGGELQFDVDPVRLPVAVCRVVASMMSAVLDDVVAAPKSSGSSGTIALALKRRGGMNFVFISDRGFRDYSRHRQIAVAPIQELAEGLGGAWRFSASFDTRIAVVALQYHCDSLRLPLHPASIGEQHKPAGHEPIGHTAAPMPHRF